MPDIAVTEPIKLTKAAKRRKMGVIKYCLRLEGSVRRVDSLRQEEEWKAIESEKSCRHAYEEGSDLSEDEDFLRSHTVPNLGRADKT